MKTLMRAVCSRDLSKKGRREYFRIFSILFILFAGWTFASFFVNRRSLVGGNLNLLASGCGTPNELDVRGKLLFLEDVGEYSYHIDGYLQQLFNAGKFSECAGIIFGGFTDCNEEYERSNSFSVDDLLEQIAQRVKVPVIKNLQAGHMKDKLTLCLGRTYRMDADAGRIRLVG